MQICGFGQSALDYANDLYAIWRHLGEAECVEQIEAHMESEGFTEDVISGELDRLGLYSDNEHEMVIVSPDGRIDRFC